MLVYKIGKILFQSLSFQRLSKIAVEDFFFFLFMNRNPMKRNGGGIELHDFLELMLMYKLVPM